MSNETHSEFDDLLMAEIEELFRHRLADGEQNGLSTDDLHQLADRYQQMYELLDSCFHRQPAPGFDRAFRDETYHFIADGFMDKLHSLYDDEVLLSDEQAGSLIHQTRAKLQRIRRLLEC